MSISDKAVESAARAAWDDAMQYEYEEAYLTRPQMEALQESNPHMTTK